MAFSYKPSRLIYRRSKPAYATSFLEEANLEISPTSAMKLEEVKLPNPGIERTSSIYNI